MGVEMANQVRLLKDGSADAWRDTFWENKKRIFGYVSGLVDIPEDAEDLTQITWLNAVIGLQGFREECPLIFWLLRIATRAAHDKSKYDKAMKRSAICIPLDLDIHAPYLDPEYAELSLVLVNALNDLSENQRNAFLAFTLFGMSWKKIGETFDCSPNAAKTRIKHARDSLRANPNLSALYEGEDSTEE